MQFQASEQPEPLDVMAARHEPTGPPPEDEDAARQAIEYAFTDPMERSADGNSLVNVEDGAALTPYADQVIGRCGWFIAERENVVELIKFLDATNAVVWTTVKLKDRPPYPIRIYQEGRAVVVDGRWKMARETICERWARAGVHCPPRTSD
jgi:hypothetical protein